MSDSKLPKPTSASRITLIALCNPGSVDCDAGRTMITSPTLASVNGSVIFIGASCAQSRAADRLP